ncbi:MAG: DEAD/DEAH box helicase, partial [Phycisphaerae bacterium]|nr:DEAD/DEAH box helicase [Phycisphaerae bacterium]
MSDIFDTGTTFKQLGLSAPILRAVDDMGFTHPTYVQAEVIPIALAGRDILAQSKTGTGKTAAFGIPVLEKISRTKT